MNSQKKHPIDAIFKKKFSQHSVEPSEELRNRFLEMTKRSKKSRIRPFWYFSAAASVLFLLGMGWILLGIEQANSPQLNTSLSGNVLIDKKEKSNSALEKPASKEFKNVSNNESVFLVQNKGVSTEIEETNDSRPINESILTEQVLAQQIKETSLRPQVSMEITKIENTKKPVFIASTNNLQKKSMVLDLKEESSFAHQQSDIKNEKTLAIKVFTTLKYLKNGRELDEMEDVSSKKNSTFARNEDTFIGHEAMEMRQRFQWIKGKLSKL